MNKSQLLEALASEIDSDLSLIDLKKSASRLVKGAGSLNSKIILIGEAPGKKEDETGLPFVGASGKILDSALALAEISRDDVYITNIVKYRPLNNRDPSKLEKQAFLPYLIKEINIIKPELIVTLGRHSLASLAPEARIGEDHGRVISLNLSGEEYDIMPMYHPAATIYNRKLRSDFEQDFIELGKVLKSKN